MVEDPSKKEQEDGGTEAEEELIATATKLLAEEDGTITQSNE